jgi:serine/threonine protein kinase
MGTLPYISPEQWGAHGGIVDHQTDLWAVGILLFEMVSGQHPLASREGDLMVADVVQELDVHAAGREDVAQSAVGRTQRVHRDCQSSGAHAEVQNAAPSWVSSLLVPVIRETYSITAPEAGFSQRRNNDPRSA